MQRTVSDWLYTVTDSLENTVELQSLVSAEYCGSKIIIKTVVEFLVNNNSLILSYSRLDNSICVCKIKGL